jgi:hypothetical protein
VFLPVNCHLAGGVPIIRQQAYTQLVLPRVHPVEFYTQRAVNMLTLATTQLKAGMQAAEETSDQALHDWLFDAWGYAKQAQTTAQDYLDSRKDGQAG